MSWVTSQSQYGSGNVTPVVNENVADQPLLPHGLLARTRQKYCVIGTSGADGVQFASSTVSVATTLVKPASVATSIV